MACGVVIAKDDCVGYAVWKCSAAQPRLAIIKEMFAL